MKVFMWAMEVVYPRIHIVCVYSTNYLIFPVADSGIKASV